MLFMQCLAHTKDASLCNDQCAQLLALNDIVPVSWVYVLCVNLSGMFPFFII